MPERFEIYIVYKRRYINTLPFLSFIRGSSASHWTSFQVDYYSDTQWPPIVCRKNRILITERIVRRICDFGAVIHVSRPTCT